MTLGEVYIAGMQGEIDTDNQPIAWRGIRAVHEEHIDGPIHLEHNFATPKHTYVPIPDTNVAPGQVAEFNLTFKQDGADLFSREVQVNHHAIGPITIDIDIPVMP